MIKSQENGISLLVIFVDRQKECISKNCDQIEPFSFLLSKSDSSSSPDKYLVTVSFKTKYDLKSQKHFCCMTEMSYSLQCQTIVALVVTIVSSETVRVLGLNTKCSNAECIGLLCWVDFSPLCIFKCVLKCCASQRVQ